MSRPRRLAVSYSRFSDPKQAQGDSQDRQDEMFRHFCQAHNLTPCSEVFADKGKSGYHDEHRKNGRLGQLLAAAKDGRFEPGTVIVVEAWDRLGRLRPDKQTALVADLLKTGVSIGVCRLNDIFDEDDFGSMKWAGLSTFIMLAHQESKQKADRVSSSWRKRRDRARKARAEGKTAPVTGRTPAWLELVNGVFRPLPGPVAAVKRVFALAAEGYGRTRLIAALEAEGVPPFGNTGRWTRSYVNRILLDRRVCGEYQPRKTDDTPDGPPIADYYPRVVGEDEWLLARAGQEQRRGKDKLGRALVRPERKRVNLFRGMLTDARSGGGFYLAEKVDGGKRRLVLRNFAGHSGHGANLTFPYLVFEAAVLRLLAEVDPADVLPKKDKGAGRADVLRERLKAVRADMAGLQADLKAGYSKALAAVLRDKEAEEEDAGKELQEELAKAVRPAERAWRDLPTLAETVAGEGDPARLRLRPVLRRLVEDARVLIVRRGSWQLCVVQFFLDGGGRRDYLIAYQAAGYNRPGGWSVGSLPPRLTAKLALDLRRGDHVADLAEALTAADLADLNEGK
jgi:DNA invertase Pin-like site-specific DNA recombinase